MWCAVVRKCQLILRARDGDEEKGVLIRRSRAQDATRQVLMLNVAKLRIIKADLVTVDHLA